MWAWDTGCSTYRKRETVFNDICDTSTELGILWGILLMVVVAGGSTCEGRGSKAGEKEPRLHGGLETRMDEVFKTELMGGREDQRSDRTLRISRTQARGQEAGNFPR